MNQKIFIKSYKGKKESIIKVTIVFDGKNFQYEGDEGIILSLKNGLPHSDDARKTVTEKDGDNFIDAILARFDSPYLYAELEK